MDGKLSIEIPKQYLLIIAVHGNMGDGELPDIMRIWAQNECRRLGIEKQLIELQNDHLRELEKRMRNVLGDDVMDKLTTNIKKVAKAISDTK